MIKKPKHAVLLIGAGLIAYRLYQEIYYFDFSEGITQQTLIHFVFLFVRILAIVLFTGVIYFVFNKIEKKSKDN